MSSEYTGPPAPDGFGFNPGEFIPLAPNIFPGEAELIQLSELAMSYGIRSGNLVLAVIGGIVFLALEIINVLVQLFSGKPRAEDTITVGHRLSHSNNPAGQLAAVLILRGLDEADIVLSASDPPDSTYVNAVRHQLVLSLVAQGSDIQHAKHIAGDIWGNTQSGNQALPLELTQGLDPKFTLIGPQVIQDDYATHYNNLIQKGYEPTIAATKTTRFIFQHSRRRDLLLIQTKLRPQGNPPPPPPPCPAGQHWDFQLQQCVPDVIVPPPPPGDGDGDELTDCCEQTAYYMGLMAASLSTLAAELGKGIPPGNGNPPPSDDCCAKVVAAIADVTAQLTTIATAVAEGGAGAATTVDLKPVVDQLGKVAVEIAASGSGATAELKCICDGLAAINETLKAGASSVDVKPIVDQLEKMRTMAWETPGFWDELMTLGILSKEIAQLVPHSAPADHPVAMAMDDKKYMKSRDGADLGGMAPYVNKATGMSEFAAKSPGWSWSHAIATAVVDVPVELAMAAREIMNILWPHLRPVLVDIKSQWKEKGGDILDSLHLLLGSPAEFVLNYVTKDASAGYQATPDTFRKFAQDAFGRAFELGLGAHLLAEFGGLIFGEHDRYLGNIAAMFALASGYEEIAGAQLGPYFTAAIRQPAVYDANRAMRPLLPGLAETLIMFSRRVITGAERDTLIPFAGLAPAWVEHMSLNAHRALSPMMLAAGFMDEDIDEAQLRHTFEFMGLRDQDIEIGLRAIENRSLQRVRDAYVNEAMTAYAKGVVSDDELDGVFDAVSWGGAARSLAHKRALMMRRVTLATEVETQVTGLVAAGLMTSADGLHQLETAGVQDWQANLKITLAETRAVLTQNRRDEAAARAAERATQRNLTKAAVAEYETGVIDVTALTAALIAIGLTAAQVASIVAVEHAKRVGRLRYKFGQLLSPEAASILSDQVATIESNVKHGLLARDVAIAGLKALQVPADEATALVDRWLAAPKPPAGGA